MPIARALALSLTLCLAGAAALSAQEIDSPYRYIEPRQSIGLFAGWIDTDPGIHDLGLRSGPLLGGRYTIRLTGPLSAELTLTSGPGERNVYVIASSDSIPVLLGQAPTYLVLADAGLRFHLTGQRTWHGLAPFGTIGMGLVADLRGLSELEQVSALDQRFDFGPGFAAGIGGGTDWFLTERLSLRLDVHDYLWRVTAPPGLTAAGRSETVWTHNFAFTLGGAVHF